ncbi:MAG: hypothetical protein WCC90_13095 [Methylocella sp.]
MDADFRDTEKFYCEAEGRVADRDWPELPRIVDDLIACFDHYMTAKQETADDTSRERWAEKLKTQRSTFSAQMLQNPLAGSEQVFKPEWFESRWEVRPATLNIYIMADPSAGRTRTSDNTAIAVVGVGKGGSRYFLDGYCHRMSLTDRWDALRRLRRKWRAAPGVKLVKVGYEKYGMQADIEYFQLEMQRTGEAFAIEELAWPRECNHSKWSRIERLEPDIRDGRFYFPALISVKSG